MSSRDDIEGVLKLTKFAWETNDGRLDVWPRDRIAEIRLTDPDELPVWLTGYSRIEAGLRDEVRWRACLVGAKWLERASFHDQPVMVASYELEVIDDANA